MYLYAHITGDLVLPQIEVPGVGTVFADGFAEESTMQRILNVLQASDNANSPEAMQQLAGAAQSASVSTRRASQQLDGLGSDANAAGGAISGLSASADNYNRRMLGATRGAEQLVRNSERQLYEAIKNYVTEINKGIPEKIVNTQCAECSEQYTTPFTFDQANFFAFAS